MKIKRNKKLIVLGLIFIAFYSSLQFTKKLSLESLHRKKQELKVLKRPNTNSLKVFTKAKTKWKIADDLSKINESSIVIYNRLPKCASTITRLVIGRLLSIYPSRFDLKIESYPHIKQVLNENEQKELVAKWSSVTSSTVFIRHVRFTDFSKFHHSNPSYINVIRDPVEQFISAYYFNRFGFVGWSESKIKKWLSVKPDRERYMSLEDCLMENITWCISRNPSRYFSYFCGHDEKCSDDDKWSLERAKENVVKHFAVVGVAEKYEETLKLFEKFLPSHFSNITTLYENAKSRKSLPVTRTAKKVNPPDAVKEKLREALSLRMDFYEFITERFYRQMAYQKISRP